VRQPENSQTGSSLKNGILAKSRPFETGSFGAFHDGTDKRVRPWISGNRAFLTALLRSERSERLEVRDAHVFLRLLQMHRPSHSLLHSPLRRLRG
jgi:hypothetical protein